MADDKSKTEQKEAASPEDSFTNINPESLPEDMKSLYKSMQADYTRKTQDIASRRKEYDEREAQWKDQLKAYGQAEQELQQWRDWYKSLSEEQGEQSNQEQHLDEAKHEDLSYLDEPGSEGMKKYIAQLQDAYTKDLTGMREEIKSLRASWRDATDQTSRMFNYHAQLNELGGRYKDLNKQELLEYAIKTGQPDLEKAYKDLHQDDMIEAEVAKRLAERERELRTRGIRGPGHEILVRSKDSTPKSFAEASEQIMRDRAAQGL